MKVRTGIIAHNKDTESNNYTHFLQNEKTEKICSKFSSDLFHLSNKWDDIPEARKELKNEAQKIIDFEQNNKDGLIKYLQHLILDNHSYEFIIPYYLLCDEGDNLSIGRHKNDNFGILGNVQDILSSDSDQ